MCNRDKVDRAMLCIEQAANLKTLKNRIRGPISDEISRQFQEPDEMRLLKRQHASPCDIDLHDKKNPQRPCCIRRAATRRARQHFDKPRPVESSFPA
jgi:hypothetical protein